MLRHHQKLACNAFYWTSFSPERRGEQAVHEFSEELKKDLESLENKGNYQAKYERYFVAWLTAESRCMSSMITGGSKFPVEKAQKKRDAAEMAWAKWREWRNKYFKAVNRQRMLSPEEELDKALKELDKKVIFHESMKACNRILSRKDDTIEEKLTEIKEQYGQNLYELVLKNEAFYAKSYSRSGCYSFEGFVLTNSNARIKGLKDKVVTMKARIIRKEDWQSIVFDGGFIDIQADRVIIKHESRPAQVVIDSLKKRGFHWSRQYSSWSRKHTGNAIHDAKIICGIK
ncbi:MAG TPA: hypothetical protein DCX03_00995 [Bacteroidales bacterium]|nr:hypothetical protein [Bacteroidales bacterium]